MDFRTGCGRRSGGGTACTGCCAGWWPSTAPPARASRPPHAGWRCAWTRATSTPAPCTGRRRSRCCAPTCRSTSPGRPPRATTTWSPWRSGPGWSSRPTPPSRACASTARTWTPRSGAPQVTAAVSAVSALTAVREHLVDEQRRIVAEVVEDGGGIVVEGRDIGTVVTPDAGLKVFLTASELVRAGRRDAENTAAGRAGAAPLTRRPTSPAATGSTPPARRPRCAPRRTRSRSTPRHWTSTACSHACRNWPRTADWSPASPTQESAT